MKNRYMCYINISAKQNGGRNICWEKAKKMLKEWEENVLKYCWKKQITGERIQSYGYQNIIQLKL